MPPLLLPTKNLNPKIIPCKEKCEPQLFKVRIFSVWCRRWDSHRFAKLHFATALPTCGCSSLSCRPLKTIHRKVFFTGRSSPLKCLHKTKTTSVACRFGAGGGTHSASLNCILQLRCQPAVVARFHAGP